MQTTANLSIPYERLAEFCRSRRITELALFGSVLRDDFRLDSDVDVLVTFSPEAHWSLFDIIEMQEEVQQIFNREVDLVERKAVESSPNYIRRKHILKDLEIIYNLPGIQRWLIN